MGRAAEYLVCADLILNGWTTFLTDQGVPYDLIVDSGEDRVRVQVKATTAPRSPGRASKRATPAYFFNLRRAGKFGRRLYEMDEFDIYALVALDRRQVAYFTVRELPRQYMALRIPGLNYGPGGKDYRDFEGATFERALSLWQAIRDQGLNREKSITHQTDGPVIDALAAESAAA